MKRISIAILVLCIIIMFCACVGGESISWDDIVLGKYLPEPPKNTGKIHINSSEKLWIEITELSDKQFADYVEECKKTGFTIDADLNSSSYNAYNAEGYKLSLGHYGSDADMSVQLDAPMDMTTISWPMGIAGQKLPTPKSTTGKFSYEYDDNFFVYIAETTKADYAEYVVACSEVGFNIDYHKGDDYYYADNSEGWHISLRYEGYNTMSIYIDAPEDDDNSSEIETPATDPTLEESMTDNTESVQETVGDDNTGIDPDFKAAMDSYEAFMDEYVAYMKKYKENPNDPSLLVDYAAYLAKYAQFAKDFEKWENEDLNNTELAYYLEVNNRTVQKLLEIA